MCVSGDVREKKVRAYQLHISRLNVKKKTRHGDKNLYLAPLTKGALKIRNSSFPLNALITWYVNTHYELGSATNHVLNHVLNQRGTPPFYFFEPNFGSKNYKPGLGRDYGSKITNHVSNQILVLTMVWSRFGTRSTFETTRTFGLWCETKYSLRTSFRTLPTARRRRRLRCLRRSSHERF